MIKPNKKYVDNRTDEEWLADYYARNPIYTQEVFTRAIVLAVESAAASAGIDVDISDADVTDSFTSDKRGVPIGVGKTSDVNKTTIKGYEGGVGTGIVKRDGREIASFTYPTFTASLKSFSHSGDSIRLDIKDFMRSAIDELGLASKRGKAVDPEVLKKRAEDQLIAQQERIELKEKQTEISDKISQYAGELFKLEYQAIAGMNIAAGITPSDLAYPKRKHTGLDDEQLNSAYSGAAAAPDGFSFLNTGEPKDDDRVKQFWRENGDDRIGRLRLINTILEEHLETYAAHLKVADELHSFEDEPNPLIAEYEDKHGELRELTSKEKYRTNVLELSSKELKRRLDSEDPKDQVFGVNIIVPSIQVADLGNPDAPVVSGQMFTTSAKANKLTAKHMSIDSTVKVVGGDHTKPIDQIFLAEGIATAATLKEMIDYSPEYAGKNILILTSFDAGNFKKVGIALHEKYPHTHVAAIADNDVNVVVDTGNRPIMGKDGGYKYVGSNKNQTWTAADLPSDRSKQEKILSLNIGAKTARELNEYVLDNPNRDAASNPIKPMFSAVVVNKGETLTDFIITPVSADKTGDTPESERLISPKQDLNDLIQSHKRVLREDLKREFKASPEKPTVAMKRDRSFEEMRKLSDLIINNPVAASRASIDSIYYDRLADGFYEKAENTQEHTNTQKHTNTQAATAPAPSDPSTRQRTSVSNQAPLSAEDIEKNDLKKQIDEHLEVLFKHEVGKVLQLIDGHHTHATAVADANNTEVESRTRPHQFQALIDLHSDANSAKLSSTDFDTHYNRSLPIPDNFDFLKFNDGAGENPSKEVLVDRLARVLTNIDEYDPDYPATDAFLDKYEDHDFALSSEDENRLANLRFAFEHTPLMITTNKVLIPTFDLDSVYSVEGEKIAGGYVLEDGKFTPAGDLSTDNKVSLISGDPQHSPQTSVIVTSSYADAIQLSHDQKHDLSHTSNGGAPTIISAMSIDNLEIVAKNLNTKSHDKFVKIVAENGTNVKLDDNKQPVLTNGEYTFTGIDGSDLKASSVKSNPAEMDFQLSKNKSAMVVERINQHLIDNPELNSAGVPVTPSIAAIVINQGATHVDLISNPLVYKDRFDTPNLDPRSSYAGLSQNLVSSEESSHKKSNEARAKQGLPQSQVNKSNLAALLSKKYINEPFSLAQRSVRSSIDRNAREGYYDEPTAAKDEPAAKGASVVANTDHSPKDSPQPVTARRSSVKEQEAAEKVELRRKTKDLAEQYSKNFISEDIFKSFNASPNDKAEVNDNTNESKYEASRPAP